MSASTTQSQDSNKSVKNPDLFEKERRTLERPTSMDRRAFLRPTNRLRFYGFVASAFIALVIYATYFFSK
jgi:hypothetical protein